MFTNVYMVGEKGAVGEERWCNDPPALPAPAPGGDSCAVDGGNRTWGRRPPPQTGTRRWAAAAISPTLVTQAKTQLSPGVSVSGRPQLAVEESLRS